MNSKLIVSLLVLCLVFSLGFAQAGTGGNDTSQNMTGMNGMDNNMTGMDNMTGMKTCYFTGMMRCNMSESMDNMTGMDMSGMDNTNMDTSGMMKTCYFTGMLKCNMTGMDNMTGNTTGGSMDTGEDGKTIEVSINDFAFNPESVTISAGDTVRWTNLDSETHTATSSAFDSGTLQEGESYEFMFTDAGTYEYYCSIHPSMQGTVIVEEK